MLEYFVFEVTARSAANLLEIQPNSAALFYPKIRKVTTYYLELQAHKVFEGAVELDESYFGGGKVYAKVVTDTNSDTLMPIITRKIAPDNVVYTDCYRSDNALDVADFLP